MVLKETLQFINIWHKDAGIFKGDIDFKENQKNKVYEEIEELRIHLKTAFKISDFKWKILDDLGDIFIAFFNYNILLNAKKPLPEAFIIKLCKDIKLFKKHKIKFKGEILKPQIIYYKYDFLDDLIRTMEFNLISTEKFKFNNEFFLNWLFLCDYCNKKFNLKTKPSIILELAYVQIKNRKYSIKNGKQVR